MEEIVIKLDSDQENLLLSGDMIYDGNSTAYYHIPMYFKRNKPGEYQIITLDKLPKSIKKWAVENMESRIKESKL